MDLSRSRKRSRSNMVPVWGAVCPAVKRTGVAGGSPAPCCRDLLRHGWTGVPGATGSDTCGRCRCFYELVKGLRQQFISDHLPTGADGQVRSVAGRFGVVAAAGELATEWGILPWEIGRSYRRGSDLFPGMAYRARRHWCRRGSSGDQAGAGVFRATRDFAFRRDTRRPCRRSRTCLATSPEHGRAGRTG